jgi:ATP/maltotriose-dependent transcriptional regulator MalT
MMAGVSHQIYLGLTALLFTCLGIWLALQLMKPKTEVRVVEKQVFVPIQELAEKNAEVIENTGLSKRELEVLDLMAQGLSNQEIADRLFLSLSTVKTHCSGILQKLEVKRRTQAVDRARKLGIVNV